MSRSVPRADRDGVAKRPEDAPEPQRQGKDRLPEPDKAGLSRPARPPRRGTPCRKACAPAPPARSRRLRAAPGALADKRQAHLLAALALGPHDDGRRWPYRPSPPTRPSSRASSSRVAASSAARRASSIRPASRRAAISAPSAMAPSSRPSSRARRQRISVSCS